MRRFHGNSIHDGKHWIFLAVFPSDLDERWRFVQKKPEKSRSWYGSWDPRELFKSEIRFRQDFPRQLRWVRRVSRDALRSTLGKSQWASFSSTRIFQNADGYSWWNRWKWFGNRYGNLRPAYCFHFCMSWGFQSGSAGKYPEQWQFPRFSLKIRWPEISSWDAAATDERDAVVPVVRIGPSSD